jgi:hypothetical protein
VGIEIPSHLDPAFDFAHSVGAYLGVVIEKTFAETNAKLGQVHTNFGVDSANLVAFRRLHIKKLIARTVETRSREIERTNRFQVLMRDRAKVSGQHTDNTESHSLSFLLFMALTTKFLSVNLVGSI